MYYVAMKLHRALLPPILVLALIAGACRSAAPAAPAPAPETASPAAAGERPAEAPSAVTEETAAEETAAEKKVRTNTVTWTTASELDNFGFDVYRSESPDGPFERINPEVIEGAGTIDEPQDYRYTDATIDPRTTYYYYVESISMAGVRERFTPVGKAPPKVPAGAEIEGETEPRPRIRDLGVRPGVLPTGPLNAITDVEGVRVGHRTIVRGVAVRTGVTAILSHGGDLFHDKTPAAVYVGNGFGKAAGFLQVAELGNLEAPIVLTNTLSVGRAVEAVVAWTLARPGNEDVRSVNAVVGETNDGHLNDIRGMHVSRDDVWAAIDDAEGGAVAEGSVGAGTGTRAFGWKGGIGTASRRLPESLGGHTVGVLVQTNFGGVLTVDGARVGEALGRYSFHDQLAGAAVGEAPEGDPGSCMIVVATDAPLLSRNLERIARRAVLGLARTGSFLSNGSGDFVIAFSTRTLRPVGRTPGGSPSPRQVEVLPNDAMSPLFLATVEAVEEAVLNSLTRATTVRGRDGHVAEAIPIERLREALAAAGRVAG